MVQFIESDRYMPKREF